MSKSGDAAPRFLEKRPNLAAMRWWKPLAYVTRSLEAAVRELSADLGVQPGMRVLDFGCADSQYRGLFPPDASFVGADLPGNSLAGVHIKPDGTLPVADASFNAVISTQVLEHVGDPAIYLAECRRVLRPGGRLLLSTHGIMWHHSDPVDYWRWTFEGLQRQIELSGLRCVRLKGVLGLAATGLQLFQDALYWHVPRRLRAPFGLIMQCLIVWCDRLTSDESRARDALVYVVVAEKPRDSSR